MFWVIYCVSTYLLVIMHTSIIVCLLRLTLERFTFREVNLADISWSVAKPGVWTPQLFNHRLNCWFLHVGNSGSAGWVLATYIHPYLFLFSSCLGGHEKEVLHLFLRTWHCSLHISHLPPAWSCLAISHYVHCLLKTKVSKAWAGELEEDLRSHRKCRHVYSPLAGTAAITQPLSWLTQQL